jgi:type IV secretion system protein TrbL
MSAFQQTMTVQAQITENIASDTSNLASLSNRSQSAQGSLQATQATNQLLALIAKQQLQMQSMMAAQYRAEALYQAGQTQSASDGQDATTKFSVPVRPITPEASRCGGGVHGVAASNLPRGLDTRASFRPRGLFRTVPRPDGAAASSLRTRPMENLNIIDDFLSTFSTYLDSGFGLLGGDVHALSTILIGIDVTLAGLFWALGGEDDVLAKFIRKILYIGAFAYIIGNYAALSTIIFKSFSQAGITAAGGSITADQLLKPGRLAGTGFTAAWPLLVQASKSLGFTNFFQNFLTISVLLTAWIIVIISFFILAVQLFITILEFKLTGLAGFILVPFALWNRTNFLAERVLGNVVTSGIKVMVLAVIVGIGSTYFSQFTAALQKEPDIGQAMSLVLASLALLGLGIFGPTIASGLVAGAPQLGAGSVAATGALVAGGAAAVASGGAAAAGAIGGASLGAIRAGASMGPAAFKAYRGGQADAGASTVSAGLAGVYNAARSKMAEGVAKSGEGAARRRREASRAAHSLAQRQFRDIGHADTGDSEAEAPRQARKLQSEQQARHRQQMITHSVQSGDQGGAGANPDIDEKED